MSSPRLVLVAGGLVGWWLSGSGSVQRLTVTRFSRAGHRTLRRTFPVAKLIGGRAELGDNGPLFASGPGGQLLFTLRALDRRAGRSTLMVGRWNIRLAGSPVLSAVESDRLITNGKAHDFGPQEQQLTYEHSAGSYMLAEDRTGPWQNPSSPRPCRPQVLITAISSTGGLAGRGIISLPPTASFLDPLIRLTPSGSGFDAFVIRPGDTAGKLQPDRLLDYHLGRNLRPTTKGTVIGSSLVEGQLLDEAVAGDGRGHELVLWESEDPEIPQKNAKHLQGVLVSEGRAVMVPFALSDELYPSTSQTADLMLRARSPRQYLLAWNSGAGVFYATLTFSRRSTLYTRTLFAVRHILYLQPQASLAYDPAAHLIYGLWQDPGLSASPLSISGVAPLYLARTGAGL